MSDDFMIDDAAGHFAASKRSSHREQTVAIFSQFVSFLQSNNLTTRTLLEAGQLPDDSLKIMKSDLTDEGFEVVRIAYDRWLRGIDNGKSISDTSALEKALHKTRQSD